MEEDESTPGPSVNYCMLHHIVAQPPTNEFQQLKTLRRILKRGADLFHLNEEKNPPLHHAVANYGGQIKAIKYLLKKGADQKIFNGNDLTLFQVINYSKKSYKICKFLFRVGYNLNVIRTPFPLQKAVESENCSVKTVKLLIENGARASSQTLLKAVQNTAIKPKVIELLLSYGANANTNGDFGYSPLHCAISNTNMKAEIVHSLLYAGAPVNARTTERAFTPLHLMTRKQHQCPVVTEMLLAYGADVDAKCTMGRTPLMYASRKKGGFEIVKMLLACGADPNAKDKEGLNALHHALMGFSPNGKTIKLLIRHGADVSCKADDLTPFEWYIEGPPDRFTPGAFQAFFEYGVDVHFKTSDDKSALAILLEECTDNLDAIIFLLNNRAWCTDYELEWQSAINEIADKCTETYSTDLETIIKYAILHQFYKHGQFFLLHTPSEYVAIKSQCIHECFKMHCKNLPHGNLLHMLLTQKFYSCDECMNEIFMHTSDNIGMVYFDTLLKMISKKFLLERLQAQKVYTICNNRIIMLNNDCVRMIGKYMDKTQLYMSVLAFSA
ncbi:transient receptor potential cation channel subfamily A member 1-like [Argiope bruennichi]|uniref:Putative ankyrin repeat protein L88 like protein n=1 Tax=Argiope bruennichi TaxID=94029 RepID=A0A8T0FM03_ARGBR|nr:transient receptor potential cation channel subfamily A member 1-like [Argiope bruennichi]XP_055930874.1 transient receptor potential cation channel subfamily A member 1-like [Argiope bruennichi]KAF8790430.1 putative ankyrin repeat protein L88 like protein [Argiope bruennichi]